MKNKKIIYIVVVIILISIIGILGYLYINEKSKNEDVNKNDNSNSKEEVVVSEEMDEETKYLYSMIPATLPGAGYNVYKGQLLTSKDISIRQLLLSVYYELVMNHNEEVVASAVGFEVDSDFDEDTNEYKNFYKEKCLETGNLYNSNMGECYIIGQYDSSGWNAYKEESVKNIFEEFYGGEVEYETIQRFGTNAESCDYFNGYYLCSSGGGGWFDGPHDLDIFVKVETKPNEKYIYVRYLHTLITCDYDMDICEEEIFTDEAETNKIGEEKGLYHTDEELFEKYGDQAVLYKHTYKKNDDGSYYWYSVEPVK